MNESEWLACKDPGPMLEFLRGKVSDRKQRLFAVACCAQLMPLFSSPGKRRAPELANCYRGMVEVAEKFADGAATDNDRQAAYQGGENANRLVRTEWMLFAVSAAAWTLQVTESETRTWLGALDLSKKWTWFEQAARHAYYADKKQRLVQCQLVRDIVGNPFKPLSFDPSWCTATVVEVAQDIYEQRAFERMPVLGDALEEAGCSSPEILNHCRSEGVHVRGCFVVDGVLGKE